MPLRLRLGGQLRRQRGPAHGAVPAEVALLDRDVSARARAELGTALPAVRLLLFSDAAGVNLGALRGHASLPGRLGTVRVDDGRPRL